MAISMVNMSGTPGRIPPATLVSFHINANISATRDDL